MFQNIYQHTGQQSMAFDADIICFIRPFNSSQKVLIKMCLKIKFYRKLQGNVAIWNISSFSNKQIVSNI